MTTTTSDAPSRSSDAGSILRLVTPDEKSRMRHAPGQLIDHYEILGGLGEGAYAETYKARDTRTGRVVMLKSPNPQMFGDPQIYQRFERETKIAERLDDTGVQRSLGMFSADTASPTSSWSSSRARTCGCACSESQGPDARRRRARLGAAARARASRTCTRTASLTATSSRRTSSSRPTTR